MGSKSSRTIPCHTEQVGQIRWITIQDLQESTHLACKSNKPNEQNIDFTQRTLSKQAGRNGGTISSS